MYIHSATGERTVKVVLVGRFESALLRAITAQDDPGRILLEHTYYDGLFRSSRGDDLRKAGMLVLIADQVIVPEVDWRSDFRGAPFNDADFKIKNLGFVDRDERFREWDPESILLAAFALRSGQFSSNALNILCSSRPGSITSQPVHERDTPVGSVNGYALHQLCRYIVQVRTALTSGAKLAVSEDDQFVLAELCNILADLRFPLPFELPDFRIASFNPENLAAVLCFPVPDARSIIGMVSSPQLVEYGARVGETVETASGDELERKLIREMRAARLSSEVTRRAERVFFVTSMILKPLSFSIEFGGLAGLGSEVFEQLKGWAGRHRKKVSWHLLGCAAAEKSVEEYLMSKDNVSREDEVP